MPHIRKTIVFACSLAALSATAHAEDRAVLHRLSSNGGMSGRTAKQLVAKVNQRLARAADAPPTMVDPLRAALTQAMLGTPTTNDQISAAKVRLKLYAGLNEFVLEAMFTPQSGAIANCMRDVDLSSKECTSLLAAAAETSVSKAKRRGAGPATAPIALAMAPAAGGQARSFGAAPSSGGGGSRFGGRFNSGWAQSAAAQPQPTYAAAQQPVRANYAQPQPAAAPRYAPVAAPVAAAPAAAPRFAAAAPAAASAPAYVASASPAPAASADPGEAVARKEAYKAQREAYMARQKQLFEERRAKVLGAQGGASESTPAAAPAASKPAPAEVAVKEPEADNPLDADMKAAVPGGPAAAAKPAAAATNKAGLDGDFLDGLLDDPLAKKKK
jgi:hypothetical protein